jgi:hypothetical protein
VKGGAFFLDELHPHIGLVVVERRVVIVVDATVGVVPWTLENAGCGDTLGADAMAHVNVDGWVACRGRHITETFQRCESRIPIAMRCYVLAAEPAHKVAIVKVECDQGEAEQLGAFVQG